jgi:hypothetical protein
MLAIHEPFHGAVLNSRMGRQTAEGIDIDVRGLAETGTKVTVNGVPAERKDGTWRARITLRENETDIRAAADGPQGSEERTVRVVWDRHSRPRYRFAIDDNGFFLRDIAQRRCKSIFDCFYPAFLRRMHRQYGAKFALNLFYSVSGPGGEFDLSRFPDAHKGEWKDNSDWLKLAFHARAEDPGRPYQDAAPEQLAADMDLVAGEIIRFAGEEAYSPTTLIHWGMVAQRALPVLAARGVRALSGYFRFGDKWDVNYNLDAERSEQVWRHEALKDFESGIVYSRVDMICNLTPIERVAPQLAALAADPKTAEVMDLMTHEQYFWEFYNNYIPDHQARVEAAIRWVTEKGYAPVFLHEGLLGGPGP